jgi:hypothetical protein
LHGRYYEPANVVLTETSYASRYVRSDDANRKLFAILITQPVVFIGFSVSDPDLNHLMREVNARLGIGTPQHFALMGFEVEEQRELIKNRFERKYGIQPVFYRILRETDGSENHGNLLVLLNELEKQIDGTAAQPEGSTTKRTTTEARKRLYELETRRRDVKPESSSVRPLDPLDQQKGRWGGKPEYNQRRVRTENIVESRTHNFCSFDLVVEPIGSAAPPLTGEVIFHLHQTFHPDTIVRKARDGQARLEIKGYGAFTVGIEADGGTTKLELDLERVSAMVSRTLSRSCSTNPG